MSKKLNFDSISWLILSLVVLGDFKVGNGGVNIENGSLKIPKNRFYLTHGSEYIKNGPIQAFELACLCQ